jgi:hypothetical protein
MVLEDSFTPWTLYNLADSFIYTCNKKPYWNPNRSELLWRRNKFVNADTVRGKIRRTSAQYPSRYTAFAILAEFSTIGN